MIQCDIKGCEKWCHMVCLWKVKKNPRHISLLHAAGSEDNTLFICPECVDRTAGDENHCITQANSEVARVLKGVKAQLLSQEDAEIEIVDSPISIESSEEDIGSLDLNPVAENIPEDYPIPIDTGFVSAREEKYRGFDEKEVRGLMRKISQYALDYNIESCAIIEGFGDSKDEALRHPLKVWTRVDPNAVITSGQNWYNTENVEGNHSNNHGPLTASLRSMLHLEENAPFSIPLGLRGLKFSHVHAAFLGWFVIDLLENKFDLFQLPNMKTLKAMLYGVHQFGEAS
jgi:hypothetical protein